MPAAPSSSAAASSSAASPSAALRERLGHPVIDGDGHTVEYVPALLDCLREVGGAEMIARYERFSALPWYDMTPAERIEHRVTRPGWWTRPTRNTLDRATAMLPRLRRERMDELGTDFAIVYPSLGLYAIRAADDELRRAVCRAINLMHADIFAPYADRMTPAAVIPMHTPAEALDELDFAVGRLGFKAVMIAGHVMRPVPAAARKDPELARYTCWIDNLALDSAYDYDPVWARCAELKVAPTAHSLAMGWGSRATPTNFMFNHIGHFAASGEALAKALFMGGVTRRFPQLRFGFLEGGVAWACQLYHDLVGHWHKRRPGALAAVDPACLDRDQLTRLFEHYGEGMVAGRSREEIAGSVAAMAASRDGLGPARAQDAGAPDDFAAAGIGTPMDIYDRFVPPFFFGCEADDPTTAWAFRGQPRLQALFSSDVGHWDVPDMRACVAEAYEPVEEGLLGPADFRDFVFTHPARLHAGLNPDFFRGTAVEGAVAALLGHGNGGA